MNKKLLDILVCPFDKVTSLDLLEFELGSQPPEPSNIVAQTDIRKAEVTQIRTEEKSGTNIVKEGLLHCKTCNRFYPITEEIPIILPDELRDKKKDLEFLKKWKDALPGDLLSTFKPWTVQ
jgi:uncharacterized protein